MGEGWGEVTGGELGMSPFVSIRFNYTNKSVQDVRLRVCECVFVCVCVWRMGVTVDRVDSLVSH